MELLAQAPTDGLERIWQLADIGFSFMLLVIFIVATYLGRIMYPREFKTLMDVNARMTAAISDGARVTEKSIEASEKSVQALHVAVEELKKIRIELEREKVENAILNQRRRQ
jgi:hypothetical protein